MCLVAEEIRRVRAIKGNPAFWHEDTREEGVLYENDPITMLRGIAEGREKQLKKARAS